MEELPVQTYHPDTASVCAHCGGGEIEPGFDLPLCMSCRTLLARRPFPRWLTISCVVLLGILAIAAVRSMNSFRAGIAFERGKKAEQQRDYARAADYYQQVAERFPDSTLVLVRLAVTRFRAGQLREAGRVLERLSGRETSRELAAEVNELIRSINAAATP